MTPVSGRGAVAASGVLGEAADAGTLPLPATVDAALATRLYPQWVARAARLRRIDFTAVESIDSAGVALVRALQQAARRAGVPAPELHALPPRFAQLCLAHRLDPGTH